MFTMHVVITALASLLSLQDLITAAPVEQQPLSYLASKNFQTVREE